jgi:hypothetical protein
MSYSCDSTETEQAAQHLLKEWPADHITYEIKHPVLGLPDHEIIIAIIDSQVVIMIQDLRTTLQCMHMLMTLHLDLTVPCTTGTWRKLTDRMIMLQPASHHQVL